MNQVLVVGLAGFYLWYLLSQATILDRPLGWIRDKGDALVGCSWCSGFWITAVLLLATGNYDPLTHLASAAVVGVMGRWAL